MKLLICIISLLVNSYASAEENSTYNFYFQKAPGPVTVNQGGAPNQSIAPQTVLPQAIVQQGSPAQIPAAPVQSAGSVASVVEPIATKQGSRFYLTLGYSIFRDQDNVSKLALASGDTKYFDRQMSINLEYDLFPKLSIFGEFLKSSKDVVVAKTMNANFINDGTVVSGWDNPENVVNKNVYDFAAGAAYNFLHFGSERTAGVTLSAVGGVQTVPFIKYKRTGASTATAEELKHDQNLFYGARVRLLFFEVAGFEATYRQLTRANNGEIKMAFTTAF